MNVVIMTDLEGISGVDSIANIMDKGEPYRYACERLMADTNAAVEGAIKAGAQNVYVIDGHGGGQTRLVDLLHKGVQDGTGAGGNTAGSHTHHDALVGGAFAQSDFALHLLLNGLEFC